MRAIPVTTLTVVVVVPAAAGLPATAASFDGA